MATDTSIKSLKLECWIQSELFYRRSQPMGYIHPAAVHACGCSRGSHVVVAAENSHCVFLCEANTRLSVCFSCGVFHLQLQMCHSFKNQEARTEPLANEPVPCYYTQESEEHRRRAGGRRYHPPCQCALCAVAPVV